LEKRFSVDGLRGAHVLELGSGTAAAGMVAAALGAEVTATDLAALLPHMERNIAANIAPKGANLQPQQIHVQELFWGTIAHEQQVKQPINYILVCDCIYPRMAPFEPLLV